MKKEHLPRRKFIQTSALGAAALSLPLSAKSYSKILGANDRVNMAVIGLNGRGRAHIAAINAVGNAEVAAICDVDRLLFDKVKKEAAGQIDKVKTYEDFRKILESKKIDAITVAAPDHWHTHMAVMGMQAGKNVYVEKPPCHNPAEGLKLIESQKKEGKILQVGNQQRSSPTSLQAKKDIADGIIGNAYFAKLWYTNSRGSIGTGKKINAPKNLNWNLWQGPAPRKDYMDNWVHYNWHWFWHWGTGESNNNALHEVDVARWVMGLDIPDKTNSQGGRLHFDDDWEFYDTQMMSFEYADGKMISWEGRSCNNLQFFNRGRGTTIHGTKGTILLDRDGYWLYDLNGKLLNESLEAAKSESTNTVGMGNLDILHFQNFVNAINKGEKINSPVDDVYISNLMCHLGNIAQETGKSVEMDTKLGTIKNNPDAQKFWKRDYEPGWELKV